MPNDPKTGADRIISDGRTLNITKLSRFDAGIYTCEAINSQGNSVTNVNVSVLCKSFYHSTY